MIYAKGMTKLPTHVSDGYPLSAPVMKSLERLPLDSPVTLLAGDNGSGKTTLMETLARKLNAVRIDGETAGALPKVNSFATVDKALRMEVARHPSRCFYFHAEGFVRYLDSLHRMRADAQEDLMEVERDYQGRSALAQELASMPHQRSLFELKRLYEHDITCRSHGEGHLDFYGARFQKGGLFLLDEPEGALSFFNQYVLLTMILDAAAKDGQFIISTHSPILLACPNARILHIQEGQIREVKYSELESVQFLKDFLSDPCRYTASLLSEKGNWD